MTPLQAVDIVDVLKQALEAIQDVQDRRPHDKAKEAITALRTAIEQMEAAEPVGLFPVKNNKYIRSISTDPDVHFIPLYAHPAPAVPEGWQLVPVEPTREMKDAGDELLTDTVECSHNVWNAMIAAAPKPEDVKP